jgi:hypothetical protein
LAREGADCAWNIIGARAWQEVFFAVEAFLFGEGVSRVVEAAHFCVVKCRRCSALGVQLLESFAQAEFCTFRALLDDGRSGIVGGRTRKVFPLLVLPALSQGNGHSSRDVLCFEVSSRAWDVVVDF